MESVIAGLLEDFDDGKMTRRQLIQSLAMAAAAAMPTWLPGAKVMSFWFGIARPTFARSSPTA